MWMMAFMTWPRGAVGIIARNHVSPRLCAGTMSWKHLSFLSFVPSNIYICVFSCELRGLLWIVLDEYLSELEVIPTLTVPALSHSILRTAGSNRDTVSMMSSIEHLPDS